ncbi:hypothetical protein J4E93_008058 [Alternaria ventricosa]|uniref:uncharacterized protein n=1 Tax=Alternaria ventricosa TaxID=1187951 RepID=UPI0020C5511C|nr:uncharacterized protein J4E93_008058 [Alternaria ventricosa]KAI4641179.1 hypothetical protein J4E93_008058 [Alternaria ventricosa]
MAPTLRTRGNAQASKTVASTGSKRKRGGASATHADPAPKKRKGEKTADAVSDKRTACQKAADDEATADAVPDKRTATQKAADDEAKAKEFRIKFYPEFYPPHPGDVPEEHQIKFKHIQQLGKMSYESYAIQPRPDAIDKPWELENKKRAKQMIYWAVRSRDDYQNEDGWRMELEPYVFERFKIEVGCLSTGLTDIFTYRIGERSFIQNDPENRHRIEKKPDRIYGLRTTEAMAESLQQLHITHLEENTALKYLSKRLTMSCNPDGGDQPCIYPFLAMEAKSLKGDGNWKDIETQTAIPIRNHLYLQLQLQDDQDNKMKVPGGPLSWFLAHIGEQWRVYGCYVTKSSPDSLPCYKVILLWEGSITRHDAALQLVLIMDYIVDWARDIYRPNIIRQLKSVVDKGQQSSYTVTADPDILSRTGYANSRVGDGPFAAISRAGTAEMPAKPAFDASKFTVVPFLKPVFESTGKHVDIKVWEGDKYKSRVRGLYITGWDAAYRGWDRLKTARMARCWFLLPNAQGIKIIEKAWTETQEIDDVQDPLEQRIWISLYVQYRKDSDGAPIRELTYIALTESVANTISFFQYARREQLVVTAEELEIKLREAWVSSPESYFLRYASGHTNVLCATASEYTGEIVLSFHSYSEITPWARSLDHFIKSTCENPRAEYDKAYAPCFRDTKAIHSLMLKPYCVSDPTQNCVFINAAAIKNAAAISTGICAYITNPASEEVDATWVIKHLVQMIRVLWDCKREDRKHMFHTGTGSVDNKILIWIASDPQWDLYAAIKPTLTMPRLNRVHEHLAWFRKALLRHKCGTSYQGLDWSRDGYKNVQRNIQLACKNCSLELSPASGVPVYHYSDEDFMPK